MQACTPLLTEIKCAVLVYRHDAGGSEGLVLEKPSIFRMAEAAPWSGPFDENVLYYGSSVEVI